MHKAESLINKWESDRRRWAATRPHLRHPPVRLHLTERKRRERRRSRGSTKTEKRTRNTRRRRGKAPGTGISLRESRLRAQLGTLGIGIERRIKTEKETEVKIKGVEAVLLKETGLETMISRENEITIAEGRVLWLRTHQRPKERERDTEKERSPRNRRNGAGNGYKFDSPPREVKIMEETTKSMMANLPLLSEMIESNLN